MICLFSQTLWFSLCSSMNIGFNGKLKHICNFFTFQVSTASTRIRKRFRETFKETNTNSFILHKMPETRQDKKNYNASIQNQWCVCAMCVSAGQGKRTSLHHCPRKRNLTRCFKIYKIYLP